MTPKEGQNGLWILLFFIVISTAVGAIFGASLVQMRYGEEMADFWRQLEQVKAEAKASTGRPVSPDRLPPAVRWTRSNTKQVATVFMDADDSVDLPGPYYSVYNKDGAIPGHFTVENGKIVESGENPFMGVTIPNPLK